MPIKFKPHIQEYFENLLTVSAIDDDIVVLSFFVWHFTHTSSLFTGLVRLISVDTGLDPLFVNKTQDIVPIEKDSIENTYDIDEVSPEISYRDFQNQVSVVMSGISLL